MSKDSFDNLKKRGERIKSIRLSKYVSEVEISQYVGISRASYRKIEEGLRDMRCFEAIQIAKYLNVHAFRVIGIEPRPMVSERSRELALKSGFNNWEIGNRLHNFANAVVENIQK